jgi:hypothetical protein
VGYRRENNEKSFAKVGEGGEIAILEY